MDVIYSSQFESLLEETCPNWGELLIEVKNGLNNWKKFNIYGLPDVLGY
jgi:hypothetical protein